MQMCGKPHQLMSSYNSLDSICLEWNELKTGPGTFDHFYIAYCLSFYSATLNTQALMLLINMDRLSDVQDESVVCDESVESVYVSSNHITTSTATDS